ncbi:MAG: response regulator [Desulfobacterales bacterium RIFOXYA12_FULL_46_15]|nr:MAG: response regulator [Desulfobacterales bacterium RIFOXYA12_FULL_46_15]
MNRSKILVVDDDDDFCELVVKKLIHNKMNAEGAKNGSRAMEILKHKEFDVVVLDVKMPGVSGIETLKWIKTNQPRVEVIMLTGDVSVEAGITGMQAGAFDYVSKPVPMNELMDKIRQAFEKKLGQKI